MKRAGILLVICVFVLAGCASLGTGSGLSVNQLQQVGEKLLAAEDYAGALKFLTEAEAKQPGNPAIQYYLGLAYKQRGMHSEGLAHLQKALQLKPNYSEALNAIGAVYAEGGQIELARESFQKALADPFYSTPHLAAYNLGSLYEKTGAIDRALLEYERALQFNPNYGQAWHRKAQILETLHRANEARDAYGKAITVSPDLADAHLRYGITSFQAGDMEAAVFSLTRVTKLAPNSNMATEARSYLSRIKGATPAPRPGTSSLDSFPNAFEAGPPRTTQASGAKSATGPPPEMASPQSQLPSALHPGLSASPPGQMKYVVQLGSFADKEKAEEMKKLLENKGYSPVVRHINDKARGKVFVIQLKPEQSFSKAATLVTQLKGDVPDEPEILKIPSDVKQFDEPKPGELRKPAVARNPDKSSKSIQIKGPAEAPNPANLKKVASEQESSEEPKMGEDPKSPAQELRGGTKPADMQEIGSPQTP